MNFHTLNIAKTKQATKKISNNTLTNKSFEAINLSSETPIQIMMMMMIQIIVM